MSPMVGHVVRMAGGNVHPFDMGGSSVCSMGAGRVSHLAL